MTEIGRLFKIAGTAELKARLPYAVPVRGTWSRGRVDERNVIERGHPIHFMFGSRVKYSGSTDRISSRTKFNQYAGVAENNARGVIRLVTNHNLKFFLYNKI